MKEVKCKCGKGLGFKRHDKHILHKTRCLQCEDCENETLYRTIGDTMIKNVKKMLDLIMEDFYNQYGYDHKFEYELLKEIIKKRLSLYNQKVPDMTDWDNAPKLEMQYKSLDKKRIFKPDMTNLLHKLYK